MNTLPALPSPPLRTADDLLVAGADYPEHGELWDGRFVAREPSGGPAEVVAMHIGVDLGAFVRAHHLGWVVGSSQGFLVARGPDRVLSPDVAFVSRVRLPAIPARGFIELAPDFLVEVRSPDEPAAALHAKAGIWIGHGVPVVWAVDPVARTITVHRPGLAPLEVTAPDHANAEPSLPGFVIDVGALFEPIPRYEAQGPA